MPLQRRPNSFHIGTHLKTLFTNSPPRRYRGVLMVLLIAAAIASAPPQTPRGTPVGASAQAWATIRIISGVKVHFGDERTDESLPQRDAIIRSADGNQPAKLIEFQ